MKKVLITGGSGFLGRYLSESLYSKGYSVSMLTRGETIMGHIPRYHWNPDSGEVDDSVLEHSDYIIHLAGENIAGKRWTNERKKEIIDSRVKSTNFLYEKISSKKTELKAFISASAIGYYGAVTTNKIYKEDDLPGSDFLSEVCIKWETCAKQFSTIGIRHVIFRLGVVLSANGGALKKMAIPVKFGIGSSPGSGKQCVSWIHIDDLTEMFIQAIEDESLSGPFNAVAPEHTISDNFYRTLSKILKKPLLAPRVPAFIMKTIFGEMSVMLLEGSKISSKKIIDKGFKFKFPTLEGALSNLFRNQ